MYYLLLSILCSVLLGFIFKLFPKYGVDGFQAIVFNYFTCYTCGWIHLGHFPLQADTINAPWMPSALVLGLVFVSGFNLAALTVRHFGVTIGQIMQKMSILMTVPFAILAYGESSGWGKILGFACALAAIVLVNWPRRSTENNATPSNKHLLWIPIGTWVLSGLLEVLIVRVQNEGMIVPGDPTFLIIIFGTAGVLGLSLAMVGWLKRRLLFSWKNVAAGIILGVPNYGSMLFILLALGQGLEGSFVFPATNVGVIVVTAIGAVTLFRERLSGLNWLGIAMAVGAIFLLTGQ